MAKLFISFFNGIDDAKNPSATLCFYETFFEGLKNAGNELFVYSNKLLGQDFGKIPEKLLNRIKKFDPDLIFLFNNCFFDISKDFSCPIVIYEVDSPFLYSNKAAIKENPSRYKFFVPQTCTADVLKQQFGVAGKNILPVPFFTEVRAENVPPAANISFIGTKFSDDRNINLCGRFMQTRPNESEVKIVKKFFTKLKENPFITGRELQGLNYLRSRKIANIFNFSNQDILTAVIFELSDFERKRVLSAVADLGLNLYGMYWAEKTTNEINMQLSFKEKKVYSLRHNQNIYNSSKIGININHLQAKTGFSWRVCDIMASAACLVSEYKPDFDTAFPGIKIPFFSNPYQAREQCLKLLNNENMRQDIVAACNEIIDKKYRFANILEIMEQYLGINLRGKTPGKASFVFVDHPAAAGEEKPKPNLKNKIRLKIHRHLDKKLKGKGLI
ncbi:MAG: glycosyltransferase [Elusimicrobiota bacterium]|jgi:hypothetical protein|nr:glycosyltransferase [Elusimicrobiota bacterium]